MTLVASSRASPSLIGSRGHVAFGLTAIFVATVVGGLAAADGGYFPETWGWATLLFLWIAALALTVSGTVRLGRLEFVFLAALVGLTSWIALSIIWTSSATLTVPELERALVYVSAALAALLVARRATVPALAAGVWAAVCVVSLYSLATRLFPRTFGLFDPTAGDRLSEPVGYWNGLGLFAAIGALLALGMIIHGGRAGPALAGASLVVTLPTIYFTFSRGAWIALGLGFLVAVALYPRRMRLLTAALAVGIWPALGVVVAYQSEALAQRQPSLAAAAADGRRLAALLLVLSVVAGAAALALSLADDRLRLAPAVRRGLALALATVALISLAVVFARIGSPPTLVRKAYEGFTAPAIRDDNLRTRLFSFSGSGRDEWWRVAWGQIEENPVLGSGAGTFERYWVRDRPNAVVVRDAHSLYLEVLAELGPLGLALLLVGLGTPLWAAVLARGQPLVVGMAGAYVAFLAHAAIDWDWELPAVTLAAFACGVALLVAARRSDESRRLGGLIRGSALGAVVLVAAFAAVGLVSHSALASGEDAVAAGDWRQARDDAARARRWAPWSAEPWMLQGKVTFGARDLAAARASFREAIIKDPESWNAWFYLAIASDGAARRAAVAEALRLNPLGPEVRSVRATSCFACVRERKGNSNASS